MSLFEESRACLEFLTLVRTEGVNSICTSETAPCGECYCDQNGDLTCESFTFNAYYFLDQNTGVCESSEVEVAICPDVTPVPSAAPTNAPTPTPPVPTALPTVGPTVLPTVAPTAAPTVAPTIVPTPTPTVAATAAPSATPTTSPPGTTTERIECQIDALVPWQPPLVCFIPGTRFPQGSTIVGGEFIVLQKANGTATLINDNNVTANATFFAFITNRFRVQERFEPWPIIQTTVNRVIIPPKSSFTAVLSLPFFETRLAALDPFVNFVQGLVNTRTTGNVTYNTNAVLQLGVGLTGGILESAFSTAIVDIDIFYLPP
eukprot:CAMPEP_0182442294 /NCGR_PEP_ID=MMETSP1172-20130603/1220_1 /TAXON_ID=708627 /ORGANISM="Timspurckia oligopyrenoides, Strain CCMP3278" /LENGTH=317 /DNA_ID=CAMNT_0024637065 /DNA_START=238 /DNA_END=1192 /DNA_ORIENTATION=-